MVGNAGRPLTKLGFRRDVRLFLVALTGFFAILIVALVFTLESAYGDARAARMREWNTIADRAAAEIDNSDAAAAGGILTAMQARYAIASIRLVPPARSAATTPAATAVITRNTHAGLLVIRFDDSTLAGLRRKLLAIMTISLAATAAGMILLLLYIPKITRPIEQMLDHASQLETIDPGADEQEYLIETFRKSIDTLKAQKDELRLLHDRQKTRADEFERVTAALTRSLTSGLIAVDAAAHVVDVNDAGREILRLPSRDEMTPRAIEEALGRTALAHLLREAFERRAALSREELVTEAFGGEPVVVGVTTVPLMDEENRFLGMLALFTDLTAIRKLEERVRNLQALADLGEMSAGIAHEFRNSLSTILGYLRLAQRQSSMEETHAKIRRAEEEATSLGSAIQSLLSFTRPITVEARPVDLGELARDLVGRLEAYTRGVTIEVRGAAVADADRRLLERAVENVIRNAVDAVRECGRPGTIDIAVTDAPPAITVRDNGVGIDAETAGRLFLPLQSRKPNGLGLGLPLARKIVLLHGGDIRVDGVPGEGTTVTISLPGESAVATA